MIIYYKKVTRLVTTLQHDVIGLYERVLELRHKRLEALQQASESIPDLQDKIDQFGEDSFLTVSLLRLNKKVCNVLCTLINNIFCFVAYTLHFDWILFIFDQCWEGIFFVVSYLTQMHVMYHAPWLRYYMNKIVSILQPYDSPAACINVRYYAIRFCIT